MKKFLTNFCFFSIPFFICLLLVLLIDPYNYFYKSLNIADRQLKLDVSLKLHRPLYQLLDFKNHPAKRILLGDSRTYALDVDIIKEISNKEFANLAYGGGTMPEVIKTFWWAVKETDIKEVYIGLNFSIYNNKDYKTDRVTEAEGITNNIFSYGFCTYSIESTLRILGNIFFGIIPKIGVPENSRDEFWQHMLNDVANDAYKDYRYPSNYFQDLKSISEYCNIKGIKLVFFTPATHIDLQKKVDEFKLQEYEIRFKNDLKQLGDFYDFDYPCDLTTKKDNFKDPYHFTTDVSKIIIKELFTDDVKHYGKFNKCTTY